MPTDAGTVTALVALTGAEALADEATCVGVTLIEPDDELVTVSGTLTNDGAAVYPVINVLGPGSDPYVHNAATNETWRMDGVTLDDHDLLVADMGTRRIMLEGVPVAGRPRGADWIRLLPGDNDITAGGRGVAAGFRIDITWDVIA